MGRDEEEDEKQRKQQEGEVEEEGGAEYKTERERQRGLKAHSPSNFVNSQLKLLLSIYISRCPDASGIGRRPSTTACSDATATGQSCSTCKIRQTELSQDTPSNNSFTNISEHSICPQQHAQKHHCPVDGKRHARLCRRSRGSSPPHCTVYQMTCPYYNRPCMLMSSA